MIYSHVDNIYRLKATNHKQCIIKKEGTEQLRDNHMLIIFTDLKLQITNHKQCMIKKEGREH